MKRMLPVMLFALTSVAGAAGVNPCTLLKPAEVASALGVPVSAKLLSAPRLSICEFETHNTSIGNLSVALLPANSFPSGMTLLEIFKAMPPDGLHHQVTAVSGLGDAVLTTTLQERKLNVTTVRTYTIGLLIRRGSVVLRIGGAQVTAGMSLGPPSPNASTLTSLAKLALKRLP